MRWSEEERKAIVSFIERCRSRKLSWRQIVAKWNAKFFPGRTIEALRGQYNRSDHVLKRNMTLIQGAADKATQTKIDAQELVPFVEARRLQNFSWRDIADQWNARYSACRTSRSISAAFYRQRRFNSLRGHAEPEYPQSGGIWQIRDAQAHRKIRRLSQKAPALKSFILTSISLIATPEPHRLLSIYDRNYEPPGDRQEEHMHSIQISALNSLISNSRGAHTLGETGSVDISDKGQNLRYYATWSSFH